MVEIEKSIECLKNSTVKISTSTDRGTGFFVDNNLIITCYHVIKDVKYDNIKIEINGTSITPAKIDKNEEQDIALLEVDFNSKNFVAIDSNLITQDKCKSFGYSYIEGEPVTFEYEGTDGDGYLKFKGGQFEPGLSGGAILNLRTLRVCGIVKATRDKTTSLGGFGIPIDRAKELSNIELNNPNHCLIKDDFKNRLLQKYRNKFNTISLLINSKPKAIEDIYINLAIIKEEKKKEKQEEKKEKKFKRDTYLGSYEEIHKPNEPIEIRGLIKKSKKSLIFGKAGIGKTTLCKYISYMWANDKLYTQFNYIVYITLREWRDGGLRGAIKDNYYSIETDMNIIPKIEDLNQQTLFLFDGYDELSEEKKRVLRDEIEKYNLLHYIITTRPYGYKKEDFSISEHFETIGFTDENIKEYIENFFIDERAKTSLIEFINKNKEIKHISYIPLMLEMLCTLWQNEVKNNSTLKSPMSMTELYTKVVDYILQSYAERKENKNVYLRKNRKSIKDILGKIALHGLKNRRIIFDGDFLDSILTDKEISFFENSVKESGFLKFENHARDLLDNSFEFIHLSFMEYFAALYLANLEKNEQKEFINSYKFYQNFWIFFNFLAGLIEDKKSLYDTIIKKPKDELGIYALLFLLYIGNHFKEDYFNSVIDKAIDLIKDKNIDSSLRGDIAESLSNLGRKDDKVVDTLIEFIKDKNIDSSLRGDIAKFLSNLGRNDDKVIDTLIGFIKIDSSLRGDIAESLSNLGRNDDKVVDTLIEFIKDKNIDSSLRGDIAKSLSNLGRNDDKFVDTLIGFIKDKNIDFWVRRDIAISLSSLGRSDDKVVDTLIEFIKDKNIDSSLKRDIAKFLSNLGRNDDKVVNTLIEFIKDKNIDSLLRGDIAESLSNLGRNDDKFVDTLIEFIKDKNIDFWIRGDIAESLSNLGRNDDKFVDTLIEFIKDENIDSLLRGDIAKSLSNLGRNDDKFVDTLIGFIKDKNIDFWVRENITKSLSNLGRNDDKVVDTLIEFIKDKNIDFWIRGDIAESLSNLGRNDDKVVDTLIEFIKDENIDSLLRGDIAKSLSNLGRNDDKFVDTLIGFIKDKNIDFWVRGNIAYYLSNLGRNDDKVVDTLIEFIKDKNIDSSLRGDIAKFLSNLGRNDDKFVDTLIGFIKDKNIDFWVRENITKSLSNLGRNDDKVVDTLIGFIKDENINFWVRRDIAKSLSNLGRNDDKVVDTLIGFIKIDSSLRGDIAKSLSNLGRSDDKVVDTLIEFIKDENIDFRDRRDIAISLSNLGRSDDKVVDTLIEFIKDKNIDFWVRRDIAKSLSNLGRNDDKFIDTLIEFIKDENIDFWVRRDIASSIAPLSKEKVEIFSNIDIYKFFSEFVENSSLKAFFKAFDRGYIDFESIVKKAIYDKVPLYFKENKLCSIYEDREIILQKELDKKDIEYLHMILGKSS